MTWTPPSRDETTGLSPLYPALTAGGRHHPLDLDPDQPIRLRWGIPATAGQQIEVTDQLTGRTVHSAPLHAGEVDHLVPAAALAPSRRFHWGIGPGPRAALGTGPGRIWQDSTPIWAPPPTGRIGAVRGWRDYDVTVRVQRSQIRQSGTAPAVGAGMDVPGARRLDILLRCPTQRDGYTWTVDPEAGELVSTVRADGIARELGRARWQPGSADHVEVMVSLRGDRIVTRVDGDVVHSVTDQTWRAGAAGLGAPPDARSRVTAFDVRGTDGALLADGLSTPLGCGDIDEDGVLLVAERSRGLVPAGAEWAFLRHEVDLPADGPPLAWATLFITAASAEPARQLVYRVSVNGTELGTGPVRSIGTETRYDGFDATAQLQPGRNAVGIVAWTVDDQRVQAELVLGFADGSIRIEGSGGDWLARDGADAYPTAGSIGTGYYAAPREHLISDAYPWGFDRPGHPADGWRPAVARPPFAELLPNPAAKVAAVSTAPQSVRRVAPGTVLLDFGSTRVGGLDLACVPRAMDLRIRYGELLDDAGRVRSRMATGNNYHDHWQLERRDERVRTWGLRVFRYVEVEGFPDDLDPAALRALGHVYPLGARTQITVDSPVLTEILDLCASTMEQANGNLLVDSWSREREPYEADAYLQARCNAALSADEQLAAYSLDYLLHRRTWPTEWPFYLVLYAWELYLRGGDRQALARRRDRLADLLPTRWIDPVLGLIRKEHGSDGSGSRIDHDIVDWPASERDGYQFGPVNTVVNAIASAAFAAMGRIDDALGLPTATEHARTADRLRHAMTDHLWDPAIGAYRDGLDAEGRPIVHHAAHATAFALGMGAVPPGHQQAAGQYLAQRGMVVSVYTAPFLLCGLIDAGAADTAYDLLTAEGLRTWTGMIRAGAGATMEAWSQTLKANVSCAHPWSASPLFVVVEGFAGIRPTAPGFRSFDVVPALPSQLDRLSVRQQTTAGAIEVDLRRIGTDLLVRIAVPPHAVATLRLPGLTREMPPGSHELRLPEARGTAWTGSAPLHRKTPAR